MLVIMHIYHNFDTKQSGYPFIFLSLIFIKNFSWSMEYLSQFKPSIHVIWIVIIKIEIAAEKEKKPQLHSTLSDYNKE